MPLSFADLKELARVWIATHRTQFLVLVAIAACLALIAIIMIVLIKTRPKRTKKVPELTQVKEEDGSS